MNDSVSRETSASSLLVFGDSLPTIQRYANWLTGPGVERGLIGPREVPRIWERHLLNCAVVVDRVPIDATVADIGTGAGLPGLVWSIMRPDISMSLVEPLLRRTRFLEEVVEDLGLENTVVVRARAEEMTQQFDVVTARAVAATDKLAKWTLPLVKDGGVLLALKGQSAEQEVSAARSTLGRLGAKSIVVREYGSLDVPTTVVEVQK